MLKSTMKKLRRNLLALVIFAHFGTAPALAQPTKSDVRWWQHVVNATHAAIRSVRAVAVVPRLEEMPEVATKLEQRAKNATQRGTGDRLAGKDLYEKLPGGVRLAGEPTTLKYLESHEVSHVQSVHRHPELATQLDNLDFEPAIWNRTRGSNDMTLVDRLRLQLHNASASAVGARVVTLTTVAKGGAIGALVELPVTITVETLHLANQRKTTQQAVKDATKTVGVSVLVGGTTAGVLTVAGTFGFTLGAPVLIPLAVVAGSAYVWVSSERIWNALDDETRAAVVGRQVVVLDGIRDYAQGIHDGARATIGSLREHIDAAVTEMASRQ